MTFQRITSVGFFVAVVLLFATSDAAATRNIEALEEENPLHVLLQRTDRRRKAVEDLGPHKSPTPGDSPLKTLLVRSRRKSDLELKPLFNEEIDESEMLWRGIGGMSMGPDPSTSPRVCATDVLECDDGSFVSRDPEDDCDFDECPPALVCPTDVLECDDGSFVSRDPENDCEFEECPSEVACTADVQECDDGSFVSRDPKNDCKFEECPSDVVCTEDVQECDDGSFVSRDPTNDCEFEECPSDVVCAADVQECDDGSFVSRDPTNDCEFEECPSDVVCAADVQECDDGSFVSRDPANDCQFEECPSDVVCAADVQECDDGSFVSRDPANDCEFEECPSEVAPSEVAPSEVAPAEAPSVTDPAPSDDVAPAEPPSAEGLLPPNFNIGTKEPTNILPPSFSAPIANTLSPTTMQDANPPPMVTSGARRNTIVLASSLGSVVLVAFVACIGILTCEYRKS
jgi:hypothetical protein